MMRDLLTAYKIPFNLNKSDMTIQIGKNNLIWFKSVDDPEKVKSLNLDYAYLEEVNEFTWDDYNIIKLRLRRGDHNQMYMSFNPVSAYSWLKTELYDKPTEQIAFHHSTYQDNPFLPKSYTDELEALKVQDINYYNVYTLGEWGILSNIIYSNYAIENFPGNIERGSDFGLDFGFVNHTAFVEVTEYDGEPYLRERLYQTQLTNQDLIQKLKTLVPKKATIWADSAEPARIEEIARAGFDIHAADKNVIDGIDYLRSRKLHIDAKSPNLIKELRGYKYKVMCDGTVREEPLKFRDHLCDAFRYCIYSMRKVQTRAVPVSAMSVSGSAIPDLGGSSDIPGL
jgi:phage terminase large subunit